MRDYKEAALAFSKAGHDKGELFVIINADNEYAYLADGKLRLIENPKKKKLKHIQPVFNIKEVLPDNITNENVKRYIKRYKQEHDLKEANKNVKS